MRTRPIALGLLVGAAAIGYVVWQQYPFFRGLFLDLSPETVASIPPGTPVSDVSHQFGGPPQRYRVTSWQFDVPENNFVAAQFNGPTRIGSRVRPLYLRWDNEWHTVHAKCGTVELPSSIVSELTYTSNTPVFYYLYRDAAHAFGLCLVLLLGWYTALVPLARSIRRA